jgi:hypothetical protein
MTKDIVVFLLFGHSCLYMGSFELFVEELEWPLWFGRFSFRKGVWD